MDAAFKSLPPDNLMCVPALLRSVLHETHVLASMVDQRKSLTWARRPSTSRSSKSILRR